MSSQNGRHPYTGRPNRDYLTVVLEKTGGLNDDDIFESMQNGTESQSLPGFRVTAISIGDELSEQEYKEENK